MHYGFRRKCSSVHAILTVNDNIRKKKDKKFCLQACFNGSKKLSILSILLAKMFNYEFKSPVHNVIRRYPKNGFHYGGTNGKRREKDIATGVPLVQR